MLLSGWLVAACTAPENKPPEHLLTQDQMASILIDVHLAEAKISRINLHSTDSANIVYKHLEGAIFKKNGRRYSHLSQKLHLLLIAPRRYGSHIQAGYRRAEEKS